MAEIPLIAEQAGKEGAYPVNMYWCEELENGKSGFIGTPGLTEFKEVSSSGEIRGMHDMDGYLYIVCGSSVYRYYGGTLTQCTGSLLSSAGRVWMEGNGTQVMIVDGSYGYYVTGTTLTRITDTDFPVPGSLGYQDGYGVIHEKDTGRWWISGLFDFSTWDALDFTTASGSADDAKAVISDHKELLIFGAKSMEPYWNSGNVDFPFELIKGGFLEKGIGAPESVAKDGAAVYWFSNTKQVLRTAGMGTTPQVVSTRQLDIRFQKMTTVSDAFAFCMDLGGTWYVICFPTESETWAFNAATERWHQWSSYPWTGTFQRHRANCYCHHSGKHLIGDFEDGKIYEVDVTSYVDGSSTNYIRSQVILPPVSKGGRWIYHNRFEVEFKSGVGLVTGQGSDPMMMIDWSDTQMKRWSNERQRSMGKMGEYNKEIVLYSVGRSKERFYRLRITDPVERQIHGANLNADVGGY